MHPESTAPLSIQLSASVKHLRNVARQQELMKAMYSSHVHLRFIVNILTGRLQELNRLDDDANVFKLIGPALIRQDLVEAKSNVSKRIEYIKNEMDRSDSQLKSLEGKNKDKEAEYHFKPVLLTFNNVRDRNGPGHAGAYPQKILPCKLQTKEKLHMYWNGPYACHNVWKGEARWLNRT
eukprot:scaffold50905_cov14-Tisochrysis_lutea.AAC.1